MLSSMERTLREVRERREDLAEALFKSGAIKFSPRVDSSRPLAPFDVNLSIQGNDGPLTPELVDQIGASFRDVAYLNEVEPFTCVIGTPRVAEHLASAFYYGAPSDFPSILHINLGKEGEGSRARGVEGEFKRDETVIVIDTMISARADLQIGPIYALRSVGLIVRDVMTFLSIGTTGIRKLKEEFPKIPELRVHSVFTMTELLDLFFRFGLIDQKARLASLAYIERN